MFNDIFSMGKPETNENEYGYDGQQQLKESTQWSPDLENNSSIVHSDNCLQGHDY